MRYTLVSCIFDIQKRSQSSGKRTGVTYADLFNYVNDIGLPTILFVESHLIDKIKKRDGLVIVPKNLEDLDTYKLINSMSNLKKPHNAQNLNPWFTSVINSKLSLMKEALQYVEDSDTSHLVWIDAGIAHVGTIPKDKFIEDISINLYPDKITLVMMKATTANEIENLPEYYNYNRGKIAAGLSIVPITLINWFESSVKELFNKAILEFNIMCLEEQFMSVLTVKYPQIFEYIFSDYWLLYNLRYISDRIRTVIMNLIYCRSNGLTHMGSKILKQLLKSLEYSKTTCSINEFCEILYNGQIIEYYVNKNLSKKLGLFLGYLYYNNTDGNKWMQQYLDNIKNNLKFVDINLLDPLLFTNEKILLIDDTKLLWCVH